MADVESLHPANADVGREATDVSLVLPDRSCGNVERGESEEFLGFQVRGCRCQNRLCRNCGGQLAFRMAKRLSFAIAGWLYPKMWTLTIDAGQFEDPRQIYEHLKLKRAIGGLVKELRRRGYLASEHWWCAVEFQMGERKNGGQPTMQAHFHLLIDAKFIDKHEMQELWGRFRPDWAGPVPDGRPALGIVQFEKIDNREGMAKYACKYVAKAAKEGVPPWHVEYLQEGHNVQVFQVSRGFWKQGQVEDDPKPIEEYNLAVDGAEELYEKQLAKALGEGRIGREVKRRTFQERIAECCKEAELYRVTQVGNKKRYRRECAIEGGRFEAAVVVSDTVLARSWFWVRPSDVRALDRLGMLRAGNGYMPVRELENPYWGVELTAPFVRGLAEDQRELIRQGNVGPSPRGAERPASEHRSGEVGTERESEVSLRGSG